MNKQVAFPYLIAIAAGLLLFICCASKVENKHRELACKLFSESLCLVSEYTDSLENARDSVDLKRILNKFEYKISLLNNEYPSGVYLSITEDENEALINGIDSLTRLYKDKYNKFSVTDSCVSDSCRVLF